MQEKQDKVDFGNDREDNIIEDLNTLSALYDKIKEKKNLFDELYLFTTFYEPDWLRWDQLDQTGPNQIKPEHTESNKFHAIKCT